MSLSPQATLTNRRGRKPPLLFCGPLTTCPWVDACKVEASRRKARWYLSPTIKSQAVALIALPFCYHVSEFPRTSTSGTLSFGSDVEFHLFQGFYFLSFHPQGPWSEACLPSASSCRHHAAQLSSAPTLPGPDRACLSSPHPAIQTIGTVSRWEPCLTSQLRWKCQLELRDAFRFTAKGRGKNLVLFKTN